MNKEEAERLAMRKLRQAFTGKPSMADRLAVPAWLAMIIVGAAIIVAIYFGVKS